MSAPTVIKVTAEHIAAAKQARSVSSDTPISFAMKDAYPDAYTVDVYSNWMHACGKGENWGCLETDLPGEAEEFQYAFADGEEVKPFEFTVRWATAPDDEEEV